MIIWGRYDKHTIKWGDFDWNLLKTIDIWNAFTAYISVIARWREKKVESGPRFLRHELHPLVF